MKGVGGFFLHGNEIPDKFIQNEVPSVHFDVPQFNGDDFLGVNVSCVYSSLRDDFVENCSVKFVNYSKGFRRTIILAIPMVQGDNIWKGSLFNEDINLGSKGKVKIEIDFHVTVKKTVVSLSFKKDMYANDYAGAEELTEEETGL
jgi:hypothetical protein